ncbi:MAG TPA: hypothetical protein VLY84_08810 [Dysgonamonadaceae bacterium]|uniref:Uncharacterized protein n=1 Tax=Sphingobacterium wenxiniae TaxID=683125 RepID=A0A1I6QGV3_9SPHI|nr:MULTISPECIES: hypothetical protein [Bacteroidota]MCS7472529.1 hypothetical protein [Myroides odoratimimus]MDM1086585.1 hypothetical protein [Myroides odoratimimus]SFS51701.1 hypothetical protein SAMN05660206_102337 [Sphingobacterium wenxiniae]HUI33702.1 hypothetical protein [Dysgonamonadaceae bacterium]
MAVILKKDEKIGNVVNSLAKEFGIEDFIDKFIELYPKDYAKIKKTYAEHTKDLKLGKKQPMPNPKQYLTNALNVWTKANKK